MASRKEEPDWQALAEKRLKLFVSRARREPALLRKGPKTPRWSVSVRIVGAALMTKLNAQHRGKKYATDVLSFVPLKLFFQQGVLGELVICLPVLKRQARELGHTPEAELDVLLAHGLLHLLGFDHELGAKQEAAQKRWECRLLGERASRAGLIRRSKSLAT